jgi:hypothetical protein
MTQMFFGTHEVPVAVSRAVSSTFFTYKPENYESKYVCLFQLLSGVSIISGSILIPCIGLEYVLSEIK